MNKIGTTTSTAVIIFCESEVFQNVLSGSVSEKRNTISAAVHIINDINEQLLDDVTFILEYLNKYDAAAAAPTNNPKSADFPT